MIWPRVVVGVLFIALPIWAGGFGRSLWTLPPMILVFTLAYIDGKNAIWRRAFLQGDRRFKLQQILGALIGETVLVLALFFIAAGVAAAFDALPPRAPFSRLDAGLLAATLALALGGMALLRKIEGGRDPVVRALETLGRGLAEAEADPGAAEDFEIERPDPEADDLIAEAEAAAKAPDPAEATIDDLAERLAALRPAKRVRTPALQLIDMIEEVHGPGARAARRIGYRALTLLSRTEEGGEIVVGMGAAPEVIYALKEDGSDAARLEALELAERLITLGVPGADAPGGALMSAIEAIASGEAGRRVAIDEDPGLKARLRARAEALLRRRAEA